MRKIFKKFTGAALNVVARNESVVKKAIGYSYLGGDGIVALVPLMDNGFVQKLFQSDFSSHLLWQGLGGRPLPVISSALLIAGSVAITRGKFSTMNALAGTGSAVIIVDLIQHQQYWSIGPFAIGTAAGTLGTFYRSLENRYSQSESSWKRQTLGQPKRWTGLMWSATTYPLAITSIVDGNAAMTIASGSWSLGNTGLMLLPNDAQTTSNNSIPSPSSPVANPSGKPRSNLPAPRA